MFYFEFVTVTFSIFLHQGILEAIVDNSSSISFSSSSFVFSSLSFSKEIVIDAFLGKMVALLSSGFNSLQNVIVSF